MLQRGHYWLAAQLQAEYEHQEQPISVRG